VTRSYRRILRGIVIDLLLSIPRPVSSCVRYAQRAWEVRQHSLRFSKVSVAERPIDAAKNIADPDEGHAAQLFITEAHAPPSPVD
jgi:hypothetical protein